MAFIEGAGCEFIKKSSCKNLILFIHGFTGGEETWKGSNSQHFGKLLIESKDIAENFDVAEFRYHTTFLDFKSVNFLKKIFGYSRRFNKNISIEELSRLLETEINYKLKEYKNIVFIVHSMGGLIAQSYLVKNDQRHSVRLLLSLAVPYLGSWLATYGKYIFSSPQILELSPLSDVINELNIRWPQLNNKPKVKYLYGTLDSAVPMDSAVPPYVSSDDAIACYEDHTSITKPVTRSDVAVQVCLTWLYAELKLIHQINVLIVDDNRTVGEGIRQRILKASASYESHTKINVKPYFLLADDFQAEGGKILASRIYEEIKKYNINFLLLDRQYYTLLEMERTPNVPKLNAKKEMMLYCMKSDKGARLENILKFMPKDIYRQILGMIVYTYNTPDEDSDSDSPSADVIKDALLGAINLDKRDVMSKNAIEVIMTSEEIYALAKYELYLEEPVELNNGEIAVIANRKSDFALYGVFMGEILYHHIVSTATR